MTTREIQGHLEGMYGIEASPTLISNVTEQLAGEQAKVEPKTVQGILRLSKIQPTLDLYTQEDGEKAPAAQGQFLEALMASGAIQ